MKKLIVANIAILAIGAVWIGFSLADKQKSNAITDKPTGTAIAKGAIPEAKQATKTTTAATTETSTTEAQQTTASTVDSTIQSQTTQEQATPQQATQISEWQQRATDLAEGYNSNSYTDAEIIVLTTAKLSVEYGLNDPKEIQEVQNFLTDNSWEHSYTDEEPEEQGARVPYMTALYYWNQTARNGDQDQSDRLGRVGVSLSHDGYTPDQITGLTDQLISELHLK